MAASPRLLIDTNVLVYAYDPAAGDKHRQALEVLDQLVASGTGALSTQVLAEFFHVVTRRIPQPLSILDGYDRVRVLLQAWRVLDVTGPIVLEAARGVRDHQLAFWDAQIWAVAHLNQIPVVLSEGFSPGREIESVRFLNPFQPEFNRALLG